MEPWTGLCVHGPLLTWNAVDHEQFAKIEDPLEAEMKRRKDEKK